MVTDTDLREQMMQWGAQRDDARAEVAELQRRCDALAVENERMRNALRSIRERAGSALGMEDE